MKKLHILIGNNGDGSNSLKFFDGDKFTFSQIETAAEAFPCDETYQSGDGIQIRTLTFPDDTDFSFIKTENHLPGEE